MSATTPRPEAGASAPKTGRPVAALLGFHLLVAAGYVGWIMTWPKEVTTSTGFTMPRGLPGYGGRGRCGGDRYGGHRGRNRPHCLAQLIAGGVRPGSGKQ
jgi:hypothetical protein